MALLFPHRFCWQRSQGSGWRQRVPAYIFSSVPCCRIPGWVHFRWQWDKREALLPAVRHFSRVAAELGIVIPVSFYEKEVNNTYNSIAVLDADGKNLGVYRKTHIPDDHYYQEKFYFTPGDTGFKVFDTRFGTIGVGICWDQWFPETARCILL